MAKTAPRHEWPVAVLQQVVGGLMREAPRQLIARELWAGSGSAACWWRRQQLFAASTAVMSMVMIFMPPALQAHSRCGVCVLWRPTSAGFADSFMAPEYNA